MRILFACILGLLLSAPSLVIASHQEETTTFHIQEYRANLGDVEEYRLQTVYQTRRTQRERERRRGRQNENNANLMQTLQTCADDVDYHTLMQCGAICCLSNILTSIVCLGSNHMLVD